MNNFPSDGNAQFVTTTIPAVCRSCGNVFGGVTFALGAQATLKLAGNTVGPCPNCGGLADLVDGTFAIVGAAVKRIADYVIDDMERLQAILTAAREENADVSRVAHSMREVPSFGPFAEWLLTMFAPKSSADFYAFLAVLIALIPMLTPKEPAAPAVQAPAAQQLSEERIVEITSKAVAAALNQTKAPLGNVVEPQAHADNKGARTSVVRSAPKVGRNDPCPCRSGKKHKKCCGALH